MNILVVGAGAVGQIYSYFLQKGGATVDLLVKPSHLNDCKSGFNLYSLNQNQNCENPIHYKVNGEIFTDINDVPNRFDFVLLCIPTTGMNEEWVRALAARTGGASWVNFIPGNSSGKLLEKYISPNRLLNASTVIASFTVPLANLKPKEAGTAFWIPPFTATPVAGDRAAAERISEAFGAGGFPCKYNTTVVSPMIENALVVFVACLKNVRWKLDSLLAPEPLLQFKRGLLEALAIAGASPITCAFAKTFVNKPSLQLFFSSTGLLPFPFEALFEKHFTKVGVQMQDLLSEIVRNGEEKHLPTETLKTILEGKIVK